jgi:hypothetical protein
MTKDENLADTLLDEGLSKPPINQIEDFTEFLLDDGQANSFTKPKAGKKKPSLPKPPHKPRVRHLAPPASPTPPSPPKPSPLQPGSQNTKNPFWSIIKTLFWVGLMSFALVKYFNRQTGTSENDIYRSAEMALDTFQSLKLGKTVISAENLYHGDNLNLLNGMDWADSILVLEVKNTGIHQYYIDKGKPYRAFEGYASIDGKMVGRGSYDTKYSKMIRFINIDSDFFNEVRRSCSFVSVLGRPMDVEIEVRGCDIKYDSDDDLTEITYIYNSPEDPMIYKRRTGLIYSNSLKLHSKNNVKRNRTTTSKLSDNNSSTLNEDQILSLKNQTNSQEKYIPNNSKIVAPSFEQIDDNNLSNYKDNFNINMSYDGGYIFSINSEWEQGRIFSIPRTEKSNWRKLTKLIKTKNQADTETRCCSWRLPSAEELQLIFQNSTYPNFMDGTYWTSSMSANLENHVDDEVIYSDFRKSRNDEVKSILTYNRLTGQILESSKNEKHYYILIRDFSFDEH